MELIAQNLSCGYKNQPVLSPINLTIAQGEAVCLLGPNNVGKTTFFRSVMGIIPTLSGKVLLDDTDISTLTKRQVSKQVAYVPQSHMPGFSYSVIDMVVMGRNARVPYFGYPKDIDYEIAYESLARLSVEDLATRPYDQISDGQRQMVLIARGLAQKPKILLMDEPCASLDYANQIKVLKAIRNLSYEGLGICISTNNPNHAFLACDRCMLIKEDKSIVCGSCRQILTEENLLAAYGAKITIGHIVDYKDETYTTCTPVMERKH